MTKSLAVDVVRAIADVENVDPRELDLRLENFIDTDVFEKLARRDDTDWTLSFELPDYEVTVTSTGLIVVDDLEAANVAMGEYREPDQSESRVAD